MFSSRLARDGYPRLSATVVALDLGLLALAALVVNWPLLFNYQLWPEDPLLWWSNTHMTAGDVLKTYAEFQRGWYRPTAFYGLPSLAFNLIGWHHLARLRAVGLAIMIVLLWAIYAFSLRLFPGRRVAGLVAGSYYIAHPALYGAIIQFSSLDGGHILFVIAAVMLYLESVRIGNEPRVELSSCAVERTGWRASFGRAWRVPVRERILVCLSLGCYVIALTWKEPTVLTPVYLAAISALAVVQAAGMPAAGLKRWFRDAKPILVREFRRLLPFAVVMASYLALRLSLMEGTGVGYRRTFDVAAVCCNIRNFSLWMVHVFWGAGGEHRGWLMVFNRPVCNVVGATLFVFLVVRGVVLWRRDKNYRSCVYLCVTWVLVFLVVPVYYGGFGHHVNLAMVGYAVLLGGVIAESASLVHWPKVGMLLTCLVLVSFVALGRVNATRYVAAGYHHICLTLCGNAYFAPPVPASEIGEAPLIYVEDRMRFTRWAYGVERLFAYVYDNKQAEERVVPTMNEVPANQAIAWLEHPRAFFFSYTDDLQWHDDSKAFAAVARRLAKRPSVSEHVCP